MPDHEQDIPDEVVRSVELEADRAAVWEAVADPDLRRAWLDDDDALARELRIERAEPGHALVWTWWRRDDPSSASRVEVVLDEQPGGGTRLVVTERLVAPRTGRFEARARARASAGARWDHRMLGLELLVLAVGAMVA